MWHGGGVDGSLGCGFDRDCAFKSQIYDGSKSKGVINERRVAVVVSSQTFVVLTLLPVLQLHPVRSGRTLHSSPSIHGCIWHHHFWATMEAEGREKRTYTVLKDSFRLQTAPRWHISERLTSNRNNFSVNNITSVLVSPQWGATKPLMIYLKESNRISIEAICMD